MNNLDRVLAASVAVNLLLPIHSLFAETWGHKDAIMTLVGAIGAAYLLHKHGNK